LPVYSFTKLETTAESAGAAPNTISSKGSGLNTTVSFGIGWGFKI
jgi:hypothetical protein